MLEEVDRQRATFDSTHSCWQSTQLVHSQGLEKEVVPKTCIRCCYYYCTSEIGVNLPQVERVVIDDIHEYAEGKNPLLDTKGALYMIQVTGVIINSALLLCTQFLLTHNGLIPVIVQEDINKETDECW